MSKRTRLIPPALLMEAEDEARSLRRQAAAAAVELRFISEDIQRRLADAAARLDLLASRQKPPARQDGPS